MQLRREEDSRFLFSKSNLRRTLVNFPRPLPVPSDAARGQLSRITGAEKVYSTNLDRLCRISVRNKSSGNNMRQSLSLVLDIR